MDQELQTSVTRLSRDLRAAAENLSDQEARYLVDGYYLIQEDRKRTDNQVRSMGGEPTILLQWLSDQNHILEGQIKGALDRYSNSHPVGEWMRSVPGIGPVIAAGLLAHIDINKAPTVGHIWSFAGLDPSREWKKGEKRPWNADLKTLCWKIGQSFMKLNTNDKDYYGHRYKEYKTGLIEKNEAGEFSDHAKHVLATKRIGKTTDAYKHYSEGKLPPAHIDARARRWAVKLFLAHLHQIWFEKEFGKPAPRPYALEHTGHVHLIEPPTF